MRQTFELSVVEKRQFARLKPVQGEALAFWGHAAYIRGMDPDTVLSDGGKFSALPMGHNKWWCYPSKLKCSKPPIYIEA
jgi:hypothetical protein